MAELGIIIPFQSEDPFRQTAFNFVFNYWSTNLPEANIYIGTDDSEIYNRSRARNNAFLKTHEEYLLIADADVVCSVEQIRKGLSFTKSGYFNWTIPYEWYVKVKLDGTVKIMQDAILFDVYSDARNWEAPMHQGSRASLNLVTREQYSEIRGFDENSLAWGSEDQIFTDTLECFYKSPGRIPGVAVHLWHPTSYEEREGNPYYTDSMHLWNRYKNCMNSKTDMMELIEQKRELNG